MEMTRHKLIILILAIAVLSGTYSCAESEKSRIANTMREHVEPNLADGEQFGFIGLSNRRDTTFMGSTHPCIGVIYTITNLDSGEKNRHLADVIFSDDYRTALSVTELDFDPIDYAKEKIKDAFKEKINEKLHK